MSWDDGLTDEAKEVGEAKMAAFNKSYDKKPSGSAPEGSGSGGDGGGIWMIIFLVLMAVLLWAALGRP